MCSEAVHKVSPRSLRWRGAALLSAALAAGITACGTRSGESALSAAGGAQGQASAPAPKTPPSGSLAPAAAQPSPSGTGDVCGEWSSSSGGTGAAVASKYGPLRFCFPFASNKYWVVIADPIGGGAGEVGVDVCADADAACHDGSTDHPVQNFKFYPDPNGAPVSLESEMPPTTFRISDGVAAYDVSADDQGHLSFAKVAVSR